MRKNIIRAALLVVLLLGFAIPGAALAGEGKGCSNLGTWFGVGEFPPVPPEGLTPPPWPDMFLTGWSVTVTGKSNNEGTNLFEYPNFDPTLAIFVPVGEPAPYPMAVRLGSMRGNWKRTGGNTFDYTFMGFAYDEFNIPVYIAKVSGQVVLINNCQYQETTAVMEVFAFSPLNYPDPFEDIPDDVFPMGQFYGYRATVDLPY
jgi:hypothetical protein